MSKKGDCWDNAVAESFFKTIKYEWLNRFSFENTNQLEIATKEYIQWYNTKRLHSALGYKTPLEKQIELEVQMTPNTFKAKRAACLPPDLLIISVNC